jgi:hypothetical protein
MVREIVRPPNVGVVRFQWTDGGDKGIVTNVVTDTFKEACVRLMAGSTDWAPSHIGFMFGNVASPTLAAPAETDTWATVTTVLSQVSGTPANQNVLIAPLASIPAITTGGRSPVIVFNGCSIPATEENRLDPAGKETFANGDYVYNVLLIANTAEGYKLLARAELSGFPTKTSDRELAVYWQITMTTPALPI